MLCCWFEFRCQWGWWIGELISTSSHPSLRLSLSTNKLAFDIKNFSSKHYFEAFQQCQKKISWHLFSNGKKQSRGRKCELIFYLHVSDVRSRFILILFWYVDWVTGLTFYDSVAYLVHIRCVVTGNSSSIETDYQPSLSIDPRAVVGVFRRQLKAFTSTSSSAVSLVVVVHWAAGGFVMKLNPNKSLSRKWFI